MSRSDSKRPQLSLLQTMTCFTVVAIVYVLARYFPTAFVVTMCTFVAVLILAVLLLFVILFLTMLEVLMQIPEYLRGGELWINASQPRRQPTREPQDATRYRDEI